MIICIEGGDACGKATQSKILAKRLGAVLFSFPDYETPVGKLIRRNLQSSWFITSGWDETDSGGDPYIRKEPTTNALVLQSLILTNRMERGAELRAATRAGHVVLDRYDASARVYGALDGLDPSWIAQTNAQLPVRPDLYILLDAPVEEGFRRRPERRDRYESDRPYLERVRIEYLRLFAEEQAKAARGDVMHARWRVVDATGTVDEVSKEIKVCVDEGLRWRDEVLR